MTATERMYFELERQRKKGSDLCRHIGISTSLLAGWKKQNTFPPSQYLAGIAEFLNVTVDYLLTGIEKEPSEEGQLQWHDNKNQPITLPDEVARLSELRADQALTARIEEVAQAVYAKEQLRDNRG